MTRTRTTIYTTDGEVYTSDPLDRSKANHHHHLDAMGEAIGSTTGWVRILINGDAHIFPTRNIRYVAVRLVPERIGETQTNQKDT